METNLTQEYLDRITRSCGGTVAKPATVNVRSDAASANEEATAVAGAGPGVPEWKLMCVVMEGETTGIARWCSVLSPTRKYWWSESAMQWFPVDASKGLHGQVYIGVARASAVLAVIVTCPPDWPTPAHTDDPREEPEKFDEATGPMVETITSKDGRYETTRITPNGAGYYAVNGTEKNYEVTYPDGRTEKLDKLPRTEMPQAFTTTKPKPCESIERLIDRLAKVNGSITVNHAMQFRVTGQVEKAEPRTHDEPGYPEHFALHHVYLPEDWTRGILTAIAYDLANKLDKGTVRTVLESVSRALLLTGSLDEADLLGLAVAVEDKLDIGK
jgi:hypothetical protein